MNLYADYAQLFRTLRIRYEAPQGGAEGIPLEIAGLAVPIPLGDIDSSSGLEGL